MHSRDEDTGNTVFMEALYMKHEDFILRALKEYHDMKPFNAQNSYSEETLLHKAIKGGFNKIVDALITQDNIKLNL